MMSTRYIGIVKRDYDVKSTDFLIIGGGIAGLFTALKASAYGQVTVLIKKTLKDSNTGLAQGGIAAAVHEEDSPFLHLEDTLEAGAGLCNIDAVDILVREGPDCVRELIRLGASFDMKDGSVSLTREGAHSRARILHSADTTGETIRAALVKKCEDNPSIQLREKQFLVDCLGDKNGKECYGALVYDSVCKNHYVYIAKAVIVATGGIGQIFQYSTNPPVATGDGMAAAFRMGCSLSDLEFIQFHPTVLYSRDTQRFLISEAVRGEGGKLVDHQGKRFMHLYHPLQELAPRDVVTRAIIKEMNAGNHQYVFLDASGIEQVEKRFPNIYQTCLKTGIDIKKDKIPVSPAAHFSMGGIETNTYGETSVKGLYACGEVACTGVHGANRLASNSLLEGIVFGNRIVERAEEILYRRQVSLKEIIDEFSESSVLASHNKVLDAKKAQYILKDIMWEKAGIIRTETDLKKAQGEVETLCNDISKQGNILDYYETVNMLTVAGVIIQAALWRQESRGGHYRQDYPQRDDIRWTKHMSFVNC